jgi:predicted Zn-dependent peptidase
MVKVFIDKLDLSKKPSEPEPLQQIPVRSIGVSTGNDSVEAPEWEDSVGQPPLRQVAIRTEKEKVENIKPKRVQPPKAKKSVRKTVRKLSRASGDGDFDQPVISGAAVQIKKIGAAIDLKSVGQPNTWESRQEDIATSFLSKINRVVSRPAEPLERPAENSAAPAEEGPDVFVPAASAAYKRILLSGGLRMITAPIAGTKTVTVLMMYGTGSKYESLAINGLSHFLEHMFFKGTKNRPNARRLSSDLDALGGEYNAFTAKEYTGYWIKVDSSKISSAMDILSDMLLNSKFSSSEIEKEKGVIIEEINMYHENPMMHIEDVFESCLYGDTPAGREIAGLKANVKSFKQSVFKDYFSSQYGSNSAILCLAGAVGEKEEKLAEKYFGQMPKAAFKDKLRAADAQSQPQIKINYKDGNQAIISLGVRAYDAYHRDRVALKVLAVVLGGSMSSRMFTEVREKRGLAYSVHTSVETYTDTGYLTTQAGIPVGKQGEAIKVMLGEYRKISKQLVSKEELKRAKELIKGRTIIGFEQSDNVANWYAKQAALREEILSPEEFFSKLEKVTAADIRRVAKDIFKDEKLNLAAIGPFKDEEGFKNLVRL